MFTSISKISKNKRAGRQHQLSGEPHVVRVPCAEEQNHSTNCVVGNVTSLNNKILIVGSAGMHRSMISLPRENVDSIIVSESLRTKRTLNVDGHYSRRIKKIKLFEPLLMETNDCEYGLAPCLSLQMLVTSECTIQGYSLKGKDSDYKLLSILFNRSCSSAANWSINSSDY